MNIGKAIQLLRKQRGWTQLELSWRTHTTKSNISNLENSNHGCSSTLLNHLAIAFECNISHIFLLAEQLSDASVAVKTDGLQLFPLDKFYTLPIEVQRTIYQLIEQIAPSK